MVYSCLYRTMYSLTFYMEASSVGKLRELKEILLYFITYNIYNVIYMYNNLFPDTILHTALYVSH